MLLWADNKYHNTSLEQWLRQRGVKYRVEVVSRPSGAKGFVLLHRRWVVERTFAWSGRYRRLSKDYEYHTQHSEARIRLASIQLMLKRLRPNNHHQNPPFKYEKKTRKAV